MATKNAINGKPSSSTRDKKSLFIGLSLTTLLFIAIWYFSEPTMFSYPNIIYSSMLSLNRSHDPPEPTFYDDPELSYTIDKPMRNWDTKRRDWLKLHPTFSSSSSNPRVLLLTGSQPSPCSNPFGDSLLLRCFKNKVDYCRMHGYDIFYNNAFLNPKMKSFWAKISLVRAAMMAHPEVEWIWWMDSDAMFTDMEFKIPFERYSHHNFVVHGWPNLIYEKKSWVAVNAGIFLIRNCQWSMEFLDAWASMGPQSPDYKKWGQTLKSTFQDKMFPESDDQSALIYLLLKEKRKWGDMIYIENEYSLHGYWVGIVGKLDDISTKYVAISKKIRKLRRRRAEAVTESYGGLWAEYLEKIGGERKDSWRRPFITHFTGCQPCSGNHNPDYIGDSCWVGMEKALNFADNQVLRNFGFTHTHLENTSAISLPFDYPGGDDFEDLV
ncbi:transferase [Lithospermum erythrorhizon]|uniref:Transferase n=1 Tax=Lithospermum erythrorhizon TaxID=34254 RepID=A0AAV3RM26_LITER